MVQGFGPDEKNVTVLTAMGMSRSEAAQTWKTGLVGTSTTDWLLCPNCARRATRYMAKTAGTGLISGSRTESATPIIESKHGMSFRTIRE